MSKLFTALSDVVEDFIALELIQAGETARALKVRFSINGNSFHLDFAELSDGQRALIALHTLLLIASDKASVICLDEPDNFVALAEIQPLVFEFCDVSEEEGAQLLIASHHPELVNHPGVEEKLILWRDATGATRVDDLLTRANPELPLSETIARGWENG